MRGHAILHDDVLTDVTVLDLSYEGCRLESSIALEVGERIRFSVSGRAAVNADVRWIAGRMAGVRFETIKDSPKQYWPRRSERIEIHAQVVLRRRSHLPYQVPLLDFSTHGCKVEYVERPEVGELVRLKVEGLEALEAEVCWVEPPVAGIRFLGPIHSAVFAMLVERYRDTD
jgi:hypothetical protein